MAGAEGCTVMRDDIPEALSEVKRLRELIGPSERSYAALLRDRDEAIEVARRAEAEAGKLRGDITEMSVQLSRARQDQDVLLVQSEMTSIHRLIDRVRRRWAMSISPRLRHLFGK
jgi:hypothetical protein